MVEPRNPLAEIKFFNDFEPLSPKNLQQLGKLCLGHASSSGLKARHNLNRAVPFITQRFSQVFAAHPFFQAPLLQEFANLLVEKFFLFFGNHNSHWLF